MEERAERGSTTSELRSKWVWPRVPCCLARSPAGCQTQRQRPNGFRHSQSHPARFYAWQSVSGLCKAKACRLLLPVWISQSGLVEWDVNDTYQAKFTGTGSTPKPMSMLRSGPRGCINRDPGPSINEDILIETQPQPSMRGRNPRTVPQEVFQAGLNSTLLFSGFRENHECQFSVYILK